MAAVPWKETCRVEQRKKFIEAMLEGNYSQTELSREFGISRKTARKWWKRFQEEGLLGLVDRDRITYSRPHATKPDMVALIVGARVRHPSWGPRRFTHGYKGAAAARNCRL